MECEPNEIGEEEVEKEEPKIEFLLVQDIDLGEPHAPIVTPPIDKFLKIVLGKIEDTPSNQQPVFVKIRGFSEEEIKPTIGCMAELFYFAGAIIYRGTFVIRDENIDDLGELFITNLESTVVADGCRGVFI